MTEKEELKGVRGWLAFLVFSLAVLSPARMILVFFANVTVREEMDGVAGFPLWESYKLIVLGLILAASVLLILAAYRLLRHHVWRSVQFTILSMWVVSVGMDVSGLVALLFVFGRDFAMTVLKASVPTTLAAMVYPTIWTLYLLKSRRVRNTYRKESALEEMARNLGMNA